jgi:hypothetical protein
MELTGEGMGIGTDASTGDRPGAKLDVRGYVKVGSTDATGDATPTAGMIRYNSTSNEFEGRNATDWASLGSKFVTSTFNANDIEFRRPSLFEGTVKVGYQQSSTADYKTFSGLTSITDDRLVVGRSTLGVTRFQGFNTRYNFAQSNASSYGDFSYKSRGTLDAPTAAQDKDRMYHHDYHAYNGSDYQNGASFNVRVDGTPSAGNLVGSMFNWVVRTGGASSTPHTMDFVSTGDLGIGTNANFSDRPGAKLDVRGYVKVGSSDTTADATPTAGMMRYNAGTDKFQGYVNDADGLGNPGWVDLH